MKRWPLLFALFAAGIAGVGVGQWCAASPAVRDLICRSIGRGPLVALIKNAAISEQDVSRRVEEEAFRIGQNAAVADTSRVDRVQSELVADAVAFGQARHESLDPRQRGRALSLLVAQCNAANLKQAVLSDRSLYGWSLRRFVLVHLQTLLWLDRQLGATSPTESACREFYERNPAAFTQPARYRAAHLFLAAPEGTPDQIVDTKRRTIEELSRRVHQGEDFAALTPLFSEDEATRKNGGDLNFFSGNRMPEDFIAAVAQMHPGEISGVVRTSLGFHLIKLIEVKPATRVEFDQARPEIVSRLANDERAAGSARLAAKCGDEARTFLRSRRYQN